MDTIRKGIYVSRKSHNHDIIFLVDKIIVKNNKKIAILTGIIERVEADSPVEDLEIVDKKNVRETLKLLDKKIKDRLENNLKNSKIKKNLFSRNVNLQRQITGDRTITGRILHLDGDKKYSEKSYYYYKKTGLNAIVKNVPEYKQPKVVYNLLTIYKPDILIITGHDGMIKKNIGYNDIYNYRNSRHFISAVKEARRYDLETNSNTVIFAGACQSYFEALIIAGANFASSPARILIDFLDPLIIAEKVALTEKYKYITIDDIAQDLRDGKRGVDGIGANGKMTQIGIRGRSLKSRLAGILRTVP